MAMLPAAIASCTCIFKLMEHATHHCGIIVLAAGASVRLGSPKQLLPYRQQTLLEWSIQAAMAATASPVIVVLGAYAASIKLPAAGEKMHIVVNKDWQEGMAASIRCGLQCLLEGWPYATGALFMGCDQPFISAALLNKLVSLLQQPGKAIAASAYAGTIGIPAAFDKALFPDLLQLKGDAGAKKLLLQYQDSLEKVPFQLGDMDIDTPADMEKLAAYNKGR